MVNHYASLLLNLPGENLGGERSYFTARGYSPVILPPALEAFHLVLFPKHISYYHRQFLCYSYLRLLAATGDVAEILKYDNRITYSLEALQEYFRLSRLSTPTSSSFDYSMVLFGSYTPVGQNNYYYNQYTVRQVGNLPEVTVYSEIDRLYVRGDKSSPRDIPDLHIPLELSTAGETNITKRIPVGETGLTFAIMGPLDAFTSTQGKVWSFLAEAPFLFDFQKTVGYLKHNQGLVDKMLAYGQVANPSNENLWRGHFNDVYKFAGLLNAYIGKVNDIWDQKTQM